MAHQADRGPPQAQRPGIEPFEATEDADAGHHAQKRAPRLHALCAHDLSPLRLVVRAARQRQHAVHVVRSREDEPGRGARANARRPALPRRAGRWRAARRGRGPPAGSLPGGHDAGRCRLSHHGEPAVVRDVQKAGAGAHPGPRQRRGDQPHSGHEPQRHLGEGRGGDLVRHGRGAAPQEGLGGLGNRVPHADRTLRASRARNHASGPGVARCDWRGSQRNGRADRRPGGRHARGATYQSHRRSQ